MNYINNINMKQIYILLVTICAIAFTACSKDDDSSEDGKEGVITLFIELIILLVVLCEYKLGLLIRETLLQLIGEMEMLKMPIGNDV